MHIRFEKENMREGRNVFTGWLSFPDVRNVTIVYADITLVRRFRCTQLQAPYFIKCHFLEPLTMLSFRLLLQLSDRQE
jgi:hypothetical protein